MRKTQDLTRALAIVIALGAFVQSPESVPAAAAELRRVPNDGIQPDAVVDAGGTLHLLYFAGEPRGGDLFYVRSADGGMTFSRPVRVNSHKRSAIAAGTIRGGQLAVGRRGRIHVVWNGSDAAVPPGPLHKETGRAGMPMLYSRSTPDGSSFERQRNLMRRTWALDGGGSVAADAEGRVHVFWHAQSVEEQTANESTRRVWMATSPDDGATFDEERPAWTERRGSCACCGMRAFSTSAGKLMVLFRSAMDAVNRDVHLLVSSDDGRTFSGTRIHPWNVGSCPMTSMAFAESGGRVFGAWETEGNVYFQRLDESPVNAPIAPDTSAAGRKHPRLAASANGDLLLAWSEGTAWARGGSVGWQRFDRDGRKVGAARLESGIPAWSFATVVGRPDGGFIVFY